MQRTNEGTKSGAFDFSTESAPFTLFYFGESIEY